MSAKRPSALAEAAGLRRAAEDPLSDCRPDRIGCQALPLSAEKLNPVLAFYEGVTMTRTGIELAEQVAKFGGWGHTAVIHC